VYGAGLYSFFDTYNDSCAARNSSRDCQARILSVDSESRGVRFMGLNTLGSKVMIQQGGFDLVWAEENNSSFADTLALYQQ
jgi:glucan 1,3-beta-glucosidase